MTTELPQVVPSCTGCGACCLHLGIPPFDMYDDDDFDFKILPDALKLDLQAEWDKHFGHEAERYDGRIPNATGGPCYWLDLETKRCRNYEHRPACCREFEPGCDICLEDRELAGIVTPKPVEPERSI